MNISWRTDPALKNRFHPEYPDDLQVLVHDGGPHFTTVRPEIMWARVIGKHASGYVGTLLNSPVKLKTVKKDGRLLFLAFSDEKFLPMRVTEQYLAERDQWKIEPCAKCGFNELFDPPSQLMQKTFNLAQGETMAMFTARCPLCGGTQFVSRIEDQKQSPQAQTAARRWWQFWKPTK